MSTGTTRLYVCDTNAILSYFGGVVGAADLLTSRGRRVLKDAFALVDSGVRLSIPSVVFVEIFDKWCTEEIMVRRVYREVFRFLADSPFVEIRPIDREVLEAVSEIGGILSNHEMHDKIILASAIVLQCPLISTDGSLQEYNASARVVPEVFF